MERARFVLFILSIFMKKNCRYEVLRISYFITFVVGDFKFNLYLGTIASAGESSKFYNYGKINLKFTLKSI